MNIDRAGIFKARPVAWRVQPAKDSSSVAIAIEYRITAQLVNNEWEDWSQYADHYCWGNHYVVTRQGRPNDTTVRQLAESLGWTGSLADIVSGGPPDVEVQITVKEHVYNGKTTFRAEWLNPGDYVPVPGGASEDEVRGLEARFGSLLRAAAGGAAKPAPAKPASAPKAKPPAPAPAPLDDIPF